jgi:hypothetical protein
MRDLCPSLSSFLSLHSAHHVYPSSLVLLIHLLFYDSIPFATPYNSFLALLLAAADTLLRLADLTLAAEDTLEADLEATTERLEADLDATE